MVEPAARPSEHSAQMDVLLLLSRWRLHVCCFAYKRPRLAGPRFLWVRELSFEGERSEVTTQAQHTHSAHKRLRGKWSDIPVAGALRQISSQSAIPPNVRACGMDRTEEQIPLISQIISLDTRGSNGMGCVDRGRRGGMRVPRGKKEGFF